MTRSAYLLAACLILGSVSASAGIFDRVPSPTGNYCKDEVVEFFEARFPGAQMKKLFTAGSGRTWEFWMETNLCQGYFVYDFSGFDKGECSNVQYGSRSRFMQRVWAYGECRDLMPRDEYPRY